MGPVPIEEIYKKWRALQAEGIDYGTPRGDYVAEIIGCSDITYEQFGYIEFAGGWICWADSCGAHGVRRSFLNAWRGNLQTLGYPVTTTRPTGCGQGSVSYFVGGSLISESGDWSRRYRQPPDELPIWKFGNPGWEWLVVVLTHEGAEKLFLREDIDVSPVSTDFTKNIAILLRGVFPSGGYSVEGPIGFSIYRSLVQFDVHAISPGDGCHAIMMMSFPYWGVVIPRGHIEGGVPGEVRLNLTWQKGPPCE